MKLSVLNTGYLETDKNNVVGCSVIGTFSAPHIQNEWIKLPVLCFLIETDEGYVLYDTGSNPKAMDGYWPKGLQEIYPLYQKKEETLEDLFHVLSLSVLPVGRRHRRLLPSESLASRLRG